MSRTRDASKSSFATGMRCLEMLVSSPRPLGLSQIAAGMEMAPSSTHDVLHLLRELELVEQRATTRAYTVTPKLLAFAHSISLGYGLNTRIQEYLHAYSMEEYRNVCFCMLTGRESVITYAVGPLTSTVVIGSHGPVYTTAAGKAADDKVVYTYVPDMIKYYLGEDMKLPNVETYRCYEPKQLSYVKANIDKLVVKPANESGGYGLLVGPASTKEQQQACLAQIEADPRNWIAQPTLSLSTVPTLAGNELEGRHVDLRPFILSSANSTYVTTGGLTRVAMIKGSLVVNSSQGGGSKDTWIVE